MPPLFAQSASEGPPPIADEVLTATLLKLAEKIVYAMANTGELPAFKLRRQWRIKRAELDKWIDAQPRGGSAEGDDNGHK